jgi:hypothetical protein
MGVGFHGRLRRLVRGLRPSSRELSRCSALSKPMRRRCCRDYRVRPNRRELAILLTGGDDYEIWRPCRRARKARFRAAAEHAGVPVARDRRLRVGAVPNGGASQEASARPRRRSYVQRTIRGTRHDRPARERDSSMTAARRKRARAGSGTGLSAARAGPSTFALALSRARLLLGETSRCPRCP